MSGEKIYIKNVEDAIRGLKLGTKKPEDVGSIVSTNLKNLKMVNEGMHDEMLKKYSNAVKDFKNRKT